MKIKVFEKGSVLKADRNLKADSNGALESTAGYS